MIATTVEKENKTSKIKYPCIMISLDETIVLITDECSGVVLQSKYHDIGYISTGWDMSRFTPFYGKIKLEQKS